MKISAAILGLVFGLPLFAQETQLGADFRGEGDRFHQSCAAGFNFSSIASCAELLFTDHPLHIAVGSLAPQNGFGAGLAFVTHWTPNESWRLSWDADAVATPNASWRAGVYMTAVYTHERAIQVGTGAPGPTPISNLSVHEYPVFHAYAQNTSLNNVSYFGLGPNTSLNARANFGIRQTIVGANVVWPVGKLKPLNLSLLGEANGRFVDIRPAHIAGIPSIDQLYDDVTAPGLTTQPAFAQFGEGIRLRPSFANGFVRLNYLFKYSQFAAPDSIFSFQRFTTDLSHQFPLYRTSRTSVARDFNGPDDCSVDAAVHQCPSITRNLEGSVNLRFLLNESFTSAGHTVPFYFDPTLGGSDVNGEPLLNSYPDYRFRAPNMMLLRGSFEHSIYKWPIGAVFMVDEGKVALTHGDLDFSHLAHSYSVGLTVRAGGLPVASLLFSWGGHEGTHTTAIVDNSLLGATQRPSLY